MKYLVVLIVIALGIWLWRRNREQSNSETDKPPSQMPYTKAASKTASQAPLMMLSCSVCGVHLPKSDAVMGKQGSYCSAAHRQQQES